MIHVSLSDDPLLRRTRSFKIPGFVLSMTFAKYTQPSERRLAFLASCGTVVCQFHYKCAVLNWGLFSLSGSAVLHVGSYASYLLCRDLHRNCPFILNRWTEMDAGTAVRGRSRTLPAKSSGLVHSKRPTWHQLKVRSKISTM